MRKLSCAVAALVLTLTPSVVFAQQAVTPPTVLFKALEGHWSCAGGFPNGRKLAADLSFTPENGGRVLRFTHSDRDSSTYWQNATWLFEAKPGRVLSLSASGSTTSPNVSAALFNAAQWTDSSIVLEADTLKSPPWTANRFSYEVFGGRQLKMRWEVQRSGTWVLGDSLICARAK